MSLKKITDLCTSHIVTQDTPSILQVEIHEYSLLRNELFPNTLKPKHHFLIHYPRVMKIIGPLANVSSSRDEAKHQEGKQAARAAICRKNINHTIAVRHQLKLNFKFFTQATAFSEFSIGPISSEDFDTSSISLINNLPIKNFQLLKWIRRQDLFIKEKSILIFSESDGPKFYKVVHCYYCQQNSQIFLAIQKLDNVYCDEHYDAYQILDSNNLE